MSKIRVNLANPMELCEIPGITQTDADAVVRYRAAHGPIKNADQLTQIMGGRELGADTRARLDFDPASMTAPESPGA